jgi:hypothetical protein
LPGALAGRSVCLLREQGVGDELFFLRFAVVLKSLGAEITHQAHPKLASLLERVPALDHIAAAGDPPPDADAQLLIGDLPRALSRFAAASLPPPLALPVLPGQIERLRERLRSLGPPPYVGVTWRAGTPPSEQRGTTWALHKEIGLDALGTVLRAVNGTWIALQRHPAPGEVGQLASLAGVPVHDFSALNDDLEAMLALLALLDDYIGVSNTNMHAPAWAVPRGCSCRVPRNGAGWPRATNRPGSRDSESTASVSTATGMKPLQR